MTPDEIDRLSIRDFNALVDFAESYNEAQKG